MEDTRGHDDGPAFKPLVSVVIPTRNRADCLPHALDSAYGQEGRGDRFDLEIIVVDDASTDATSEVIRPYDGIRYIQLPERRGVSAATNVALRASRGSFITFLDDDDIWLPHKLRVQVPLLEAHPDVGVVYGQSVVRSKGTEELYPDASKAPSGSVFMEMLMDNFCGHHASMLARRTAFERAGYFDETLMSHVDYDMSLRLAFHVRFLFAPGAVDVYNLSPRGLWLTRAASGMGRPDAARVIENALRLLPDVPQYEEAKREARARVALNAVYPLLLVDDLTQARAAVVAALHAQPWLIRYHWARSVVGDVAAKLALSTPSPVSTAREFCAEVRSAIPHQTMKERWYMRHAIGGIWADTALSLASAGPSGDRDSGYAAAMAMAIMPSCLNRPALLRLIARRLLGRRADAIVTAWYTRVRRLIGAGGVNSTDGASEA